MGHTASPSGSDPTLAKLAAAAAAVPVAPCSLAARSPQISGIHVTGLVSCTRIFQMSVSSDAPFIPSICRAEALPDAAAFCLSSVACSLTARSAVRPAGNAADVARTPRCGLLAQQRTTGMVCARRTNARTRGTRITSSSTPAPRRNLPRAAGRTHLVPNGRAITDLRPADAGAEARWLQRIPVACIVCVGVSTSCQGWRGLERSVQDVAKGRRSSVEGDAVCRAMRGPIADGMAFFSSCSCPVPRTTGARRPAGVEQPSSCYYGRVRQDLENSDLAPGGGLDPGPSGCPAAAGVDRRGARDPCCMRASGRCWSDSAKCRVETAPR